MRARGALLLVCWLLKAFAGREPQPHPAKPHPEDRLVGIGCKTQAVNESEPGVATVRVVVRGLAPFSVYSLHVVVLDQVSRNGLIDQLHRVEATADQATSGVELKIPALVSAQYLFEVTVLDVYKGLSYEESLLAFKRWPYVFELDSEVRGEPGEARREKESKLPRPREDDRDQAVQHAHQRVPHDEDEGRVGVLISGELAKKLMEVTEHSSRSQVMNVLLQLKASLNEGEASRRSGPLDAGRDQRHAEDRHHPPITIHAELLPRLMSDTRDLRVYLDGVQSGMDYQIEVQKLDRQTGQASQRRVVLLHVEEEEDAVMVQEVAVELAAADDEQDTMRLCIQVFHHRPAPAGKGRLLATENVTVRLTRDDNGCRANVIWPPRAADESHVVGQGGQNTYAGHGQDGCTCAGRSKQAQAADGLVTLSTVASIERTGQVLSVAAHWRGAMAVVLYARTGREEAAFRAVVARLEGWLRAREYPMRILVVSACYKNHSRSGDVHYFPINILRQHSIACACTEWVWYIDADFVPNEHAFARIQHHIRAAAAGSEAFVVPCFKQKQGGARQRAHDSWPPASSFSAHEHRCHEDDTGSNCVMVSVSSEPLQMADLLLAMQRGHLVVPGLNHGATEYPRWLALAEEKERERRESKRVDDAVARARDARARAGGETGGGGAFVSQQEPPPSDARALSYLVAYTLGYEPYVVVKKSAWKGVTSRMFDARFSDRGWDKASFVYEAATLGFRFRVLQVIAVGGTNTHREHTHTHIHARTHARMHARTHTGDCCWSDKGESV